MPARTLDVSRRLPGPDRMVKAITFGLLRAAPDAIDEHRNWGIPGHLQGFFFVIRATDIRVEADDKSAGQSQDTQRQFPGQSSIGADPWGLSGVR